MGEKNGRHRGKVGGWCGVEVLVFQGRVVREGREAGGGGGRGVVIHRAHRVWGHEDFRVDDGIGNLTSSRTMGLGNYVLTDDVLAEDGVNRLTREFTVTSSRTMGLGNLRPHGRHPHGRWG